MYRDARTRRVEPYGLLFTIHDSRLFVVKFKEDYTILDRRTRHRPNNSNTRENRRKIRTAWFSRRYSEADNWIEVYEINLNWERFENGKERIVGVRIFPSSFRKYGERLILLNSEQLRKHRHRHPTAKDQRTRIIVNKMTPSVPLRSRDFRRKFLILLLALSAHACNNSSNMYSFFWSRIRLFRINTKFT